MLDQSILQAAFTKGLDYHAYLKAGTPDQQANWKRIEEQVALEPEQVSLLAGFTRQMHVLVLSGRWCGDCVQQGPLLHVIAQGSSRIDLRWLERDDAPELVPHLRINAGERVPVVLFMAEDCQLVGWYGDRTLNRYRSIAAKQLGGACPMPGAPVPLDELQATLQDWLNEFERVQLLLRLSGRLRQLHGD